MPQYHNHESFDGFVNPAELYSTLPFVYDEDMSGHASYQNATHNGSRHSWKGGSIDFAFDNSQSASQPMGSPGLRDDVSVSSESNTPSPGSASTQVQNHKRRAQNRAAQRAYRDRKMRYLLGLQSGIGDIEHRIRRLQSENTELIRQLCELRAANNDLRESNRSKEAEDAQSQDLNAPDESDGPAEAWSKANFSSPATGELDALYEPFAAMWNLIHLDPSVVRGTVSAHTVLERLRAMVEFTGTKNEMKAPRSHSWPTPTSAVIRCN